MGFKRTSEGRVFFQQADNDEGPRAEKPEKEAPTLPSPESLMKGDQTQDQILLLLKSLNAKLKTSREENAAMKKQLKEYQKSVKALEERSIRHESNYIDLEEKVARKQTETFKKASRMENAVKETVKDFETARKLIETLESRTEESDKALQSLKEETEKRKELEKQLEKSAGALEALKEEIVARKTLEKDLQEKQDALAAQQKEQNDKLSDAHVALVKRISESEARQESLDNKIEEAASDYIKLDRKIDKIMDDRVRVLRKIERVEDAVMQTRDALNAKAMVLLTNQGVAGIDVPQIPDRMMDMDPVALQKRMQEEGMMPWWKRPVRLHSLVLALILLIGVTGGWFLGGAQKQDNAAQSAAEISPRVALRVEAQEVQAPAKQQDSIKMAAQEEVERGAAYAPDDLSLPQPEAMQKEETAEAVSTEGASLSIDKPASLDLMDEETLLAEMERNPDALAARLNEIEPSSLTREDLAAPADISPVKAPEARKKASELAAKIAPDPDLPEIVRKIEAQAFDGVPEAQHDMGAIYVAGHGQVKQDVNRAVAWFEAASANGVANAKYNLGVMYHQGMGVEKDLDKALALYEEAAALGHPEAQYNLGIANIEGIGVPYDPQKAAHYFESAARSNVVEAAYNLGLIYENGLLGNPRPDEALMWYKEAADRGNPEAKAALSQLADSIGVGLEDVNRIVDNVRKEKGFPVNSTSGAVDGQKDLVQDIQRELARLGLYTGTVDGQSGPMTEEAIRNYQSFSDIIPDGRPSRELLSALRGEARIEEGSREQ